MSKNWIIPDMSKFAIFILCHGRPKYQETYKALIRCGYTGRIVILVDNLDKTKDEYIKEFGDDNVFVFNKSWVAIESDSMNNFNDRRATLFVRNECWNIAKELGYDYFCVMDDDYSAFCHKQAECERISRSLDDICLWFVEYLINTPMMALAFSQGGDHIGGYDPIRRTHKRKCMNSWFCKTDRPFKFYGVMNDDINACIQNGIRGGIFLTIYTFMLHQAPTQAVAEGVTETYLKYGTYIKSFYSIMLSPSSVKIALMGEKSPRLHHKIKWSLTVPCIISETFKKV